MMNITPLAFEGKNSSPDLTALVRRLRNLPDLNEAESGFLNTLAGAIRRGADLTSHSDRIKAIARDRFETSAGAFADRIWSVERRPCKSRQEHPEWAKDHPWAAKSRELAAKRNPIIAHWGLDGGAK